MVKLALVWVKSVVVVAVIGVVVGVGTVVDDCCGVVVVVVVDVVAVGLGMSLLGVGVMDDGATVGGNNDEMGNKLELVFAVTVVDGVVVVAVAVAVAVSFVISLVAA